MCTVDVETLRHRRLSKSQSTGILDKTIRNVQKAHSNVSSRRLAGSKSRFDFTKGPERFQNDLKTPWKSNNIDSKPKRGYSTSPKPKIHHLPPDNLSPKASAYGEGFPSSPSNNQYHGENPKFVIPPQKESQPQYETYPSIFTHRSLPASRQQTPKTPLFETKETKPAYPESALRPHQALPFGYVNADLDRLYKMGSNSRQSTDVSQWMTEMLVTQMQNAVRGKLNECRV